MVKRIRWLQFWIKVNQPWLTTLTNKFCWSQVFIFFKTEFEYTLIFASSIFSVHLRNQQFSDAIFLVRLETDSEGKSSFLARSFSTIIPYSSCPAGIEFVPRLTLNLPSIHREAALHTHTSTLKIIVFCKQTACSLDICLNRTKNVCFLAAWAEITN